MIFHNCIKCDYFETIPMAKNTPRMQKYKCPKCKTIQWILHSRVQPETYPEEMVEVNELTKEVKLKEGGEKK